MQQAHPALNGIELGWSPSLAWQSPDTLQYVGVGAHTFAVKPFSDSRPNKIQIGVYTGKKNNKPPRTVSTKTDVAEWCTKHFSEGLRNYGIAVAPDTAEFMVTGTVDTFFVNETDQYRGTVVITLTVVRSSTGAKWSGRVMGGFEHWGRRFKQENFQQAYANALAGATEQFVKALLACVKSLTE